MWHVPGGARAFTGPASLMFAYGLSGLIELSNYCYEENDEDFQFGYQVFAELTLEQKVWTLHQITFGLLDEKTPIVPLTAFNEAAIASIFLELERMVDMEIDNARETDPSNTEKWQWCHAARKAILAVHEETGGNTPESLDGLEPLTEDCEEIVRWRNALDPMYDLVLWDGDYRDYSFLDSRPEINAGMKQIFGIDNEYYSSIPDDPKPARAKKLLKEADQLCDRIIEQADLILSSDPPA